MRAPRIVAAALGGTVVAALLLGVLASGAGGSTAALVELQVAPRGPGHVAASPNGVDLDDGNVPVTDACFRNREESDCRWGYDRGKTVKLTATADSGKTFVGWSTPDCPGTGSCTVKLDDDVTTVVALFSPLRLGVIYSSSNKGTVTADPGGSSCSEDQADVCFQYAPHTKVRLTATAKSGHTFKGWNPGCEPTNQATCTISVEDQPTWAGAIFDNDKAPQLPTTIKVEFQLKRGGNGSGKITASKLDCGSSCSAKYDYGQSVSLAAKADTGSVFDGWNGVCAKTETTCTFPAGPITSIKASFAKDTAPPSVPAGLTAASATRTSIALTWSASTDNAGVTGYRVYLDEATAGDTTATQYTLDGLKCGHTYGIGVDATDAAGNRSPRASAKVDTAPCALAARIAEIGVTRSGQARTLVVKLRVNRATTARVKLLSNGRRVASGRFAVRPGTNALRIGLPKRLPGGAYRLAVTLANPDGGTLALPARSAYVPRPR
jgi:hypothetical protein